MKPTSKEPSHAKDVSQLKSKFLEYYAKLPIQKLAAKYIGKDEDTITNWKKKDKKFSDELGRAKSEWALAEVGKVKKAEWLLERILREEFGEKKDGDDEQSKKLDDFMDRAANILR